MSAKSRDRVLRALETIIEVCGMLAILWPLISKKKGRK